MTAAEAGSVKTCVLCGHFMLPGEPLQPYAELHEVHVSCYRERFDPPDVAMLIDDEQDMTENDRRVFREQAWALQDEYAANPDTSAADEAMRQIRQTAERMMAERDGGGDEDERVCFVDACANCGDGARHDLDDETVTRNADGDALCPSCGADRGVYSASVCCRHDAEPTPDQAARALAAPQSPAGEQVGEEQRFRGEAKGGACVADCPYPAAARVVALYLNEFADETLPFADLIAECARRASAELSRLRSLASEEGLKRLALRICAVIDVEEAAVRAGQQDGRHDFSEIVAVLASYFEYKK